MKKKIYILLLLLFIIPINVFGLSDDYTDIISDIVGVEPKDNVVNIYFFYGDGCPHCAREEKTLNLLENKYGKDIKIYRFETWRNEKNRKNMIKAKNEVDAKKSGVSENSVPFTVIGDKYYSGYGEYVATSLEEDINYYLETQSKEVIKEAKEKKMSIPLIGEVSITETSVGVAAIILGIVDGFNPCAMWILLFLINMLFGLKNKKKMFILGFTFLFTSALFYFISMLGINVILGFVRTEVLRIIIGLFAIGVGLYNLYVYFKERNEEDGCHVVDEDKRKKIVSKLKKIKNARNMFFALLGIIALAISVNAVELACSTGFPVIFSEIMVANNVTGVARILYLILYVIFYMLDDMVVFTIAVSTLSIAGMTTKYNKLVKVLGGIIMIIVGILLIFKYNWLTFNF